MTNITDLEPKLLWKHFNNICSIPHPSEHEKELTDYIYTFGKQLSLDTKIDAVGNIIIKKPATVGFENNKTIILQAHIDMVPQKNSDVQHDFLRDAIKPIIDGEWVKAQNTTLGADNGIGAASILAILEDRTISHGPIEALFTIGEEIGMIGAFGLQPNTLEGSILINTDTEDDEEIIIGCAGGEDANCIFKFKTQNIQTKGITYTIKISGLLGGHSGVNIHMNRANANIVLCRIVKQLMIRFGAQIASVEGGNMRNAIPREAHATIVIPEINQHEFLQFMKIVTLNIQEEFYPIEKDIAILATECKDSTVCLLPKDAERIINAILTIPNGVITYEDSADLTVRTSNNLSIIKTLESSIEVNCLLRSSDDTEKQNLGKAIKDICILFKGEVELTGSYPGWKPNYESAFLKKIINPYEAVYNRKAKIKVVHAGLECGIIGNSHPHLDMISIGPTIQYPHSPDEKVNIASVGRYWQLLKRTLALK
ncbi:MAG: aminoacyl-histidine dipeptidase [Bacteroidales bacterium]|nr:aminoacyl-histidine dipeptidase [Bacteroidales bacterium]